MPHATSDAKMSGPTVNGTRASSQFIDHLTSYPVVSDGIETFKSNPYGKKSLELADSAYSRFGKPVEPYLETPKQYAAPYAKKADELADSGLSQIETRFPIVKEDKSLEVPEGGTRLIFEISARPVRDTRGELVGGVMTIRDVTEGERERVESVRTESNFRECDLAWFFTTY